MEAAERESREAIALAEFRQYGIDSKQVWSVYSGRPGCVCGCRGKYTYASEHREASGKFRGYPVRDEEVSDRSVAMLAKKMNRFLKEDPDDARFMVDVEQDDRTWISYETDNRVWTVYFGE